MTAVVTGANRGIGLEFARQLLQAGWQVVAGYRDAGRSQQLLAEVSQSGHLYPFQIDVAKAEDADRLGDFLAGQFGKLDLLINNAGIGLAGPASVDEVEISAVRESLEVNLLGPLLVSRALRPLLVRGTSPKIVNIGSRLGSVKLSSGRTVGYRLSKSALNMLTKIQSEAYASDGIVCVVISPGWVQTDMGGPNATLTPAQSVSSMLELIEGLTSRQNGAFLNIEGKKIPY
jgi:NAD(P)-dependent dehydrogenase (short-subunit alcohol dehydrogenase family)